MKLEKTKIEQMKLEKAKLGKIMNKILKANRKIKVTVKLVVVTCRDGDGSLELAL